MSRQRVDRALAAVLLAAASLGATAQSVLKFQSTAGDYIGQGATVTVTDAQATFSPQLIGTPDGMFVRLLIQGPSVFYFLDLAAPPGQVLAPGGYEEAARASFREASPGIDFSGQGRGCNEVLGRFTVLDIGIAPGPTLTRLAANFEQHCELTGPPLYGEIRYNSAIPLSSNAPPGDATPDAFTLQAQSPVAPGSIVLSNAIRVYGINTSVPVTISGGEYSINGAPFTAAIGTAINTDSIVVRVAASATPGGVAQATLDVGGTSATLSVTTYLPGSPLTAFHYRSPTGDYIGAGIERLYAAPPNIITAARNSANGVAIHVSGTGGSRWDINFALPGGAVPVPGRYTGATRFPFNGSGAGLDMSGEGRGCNTLSGEFTILDAAFNADGSVQAFAADFVQSCETTMPPLRGSIRFNSSATFSAFDPVTPPAGCVTRADFKRDADGDGLPDCVEPNVGRDQSVKDNDIFTDPRLFVMQQYRDVLGREGDADGIDYWTDQVATLGRAEIIRIFLRTPEFLDAIAPVARLYFAYFLRIPDYNGLNFWTDYVRQGNPLEAVSQQFSGSPEFLAMYGALDNAQFVDQVYRNVLGRSPDAGGLAFWTHELDSGARSRGDVMLSFSNSAEYVAAISNEVYVAMIYHAMMARAADPAGFDYWTAFVDQGNTGVALINHFVTSAEYRARFMP